MMDVLQMIWDWSVRVDSFRLYVIVGWWGVLVSWVIYGVCGLLKWRFYERWHWGLQMVMVGLVVVGIGGIVWPVPEMVEPELPLFDPIEVGPEQPLEIRFDRPVALNVTGQMVPDVPGRWVMGRNRFGPLIDSLWFFPYEELPEGEYQVEVTNVESVLRVRKTRSYLFVFSIDSGENARTSNLTEQGDGFEGLLTSSDSGDVGDVVADDSGVTKEDWRLEVPLYRQQSTFTCFAAASRMALAYRDVNVSELGFWGEIAREDVARNYLTNVWGDPNRGVVGTYDGSGEGGYGAHWGPVAEALEKYVEVEVKRNWNVDEILAEVGDGNPVMVWWINGVWPAKELYWKTPEGEEVRGANGMHVEVVVGWQGAQDDPDYILTNDPWRGNRKYTREQFESLWKWFDNTGVVVGERKER